MFMFLYVAFVLLSSAHIGAWSVSHNFQQYGISGNASATGSLSIRTDGEHEVSTVPGIDLGEIVGDFKKIMGDLGNTLEDSVGKAHKFVENHLNDLKIDPAIIAPIVQIETLFSGLVDAGRKLQVKLDDVAKAQDLDSNDIIHKLEKLIADVFDKLKDEFVFPPPDHALGHEERKQNIDRASADVTTALATFLQQLGISEDQVRAELDNLMPLVGNVTLLIGDLIEQHPILFDALFFAMRISLAEVMIFRPILGVLGFGSNGPVKGSLAAWAQRVFFGAAVKQGSWFALLQSAGMYGKTGFWEVLGAALLATI